MVIKVNNLEINKGQFTLGPINHTFEEGYVYALTGNSGGGKTLFLQSILGSVFTNKETILYDEKNFFEHELEIKRTYSYVPDRIIFSEKLQVKTLMAKLEKLDERFDYEKCSKMLERYSVYKHLHIYELSTAQQKILLFAIGMSTESKVFVLDNPFSGVGLIDKKEMIAQLRDYMDEDKIIILVTEESEVIQTLADYVLVFEKGEMTINEDVVDLQERYNNISVEEVLLKILKGDEKND